MMSPNRTALHGSKNRGRLPSNSVLSGAYIAPKATPNHAPKATPHHANRIVFHRLIIYPQLWAKARTMQQWIDRSGIAQRPMPMPFQWSGGGRVDHA
jgi:hypothetical protein